MAGGALFFDDHDDQTQLRELERDGAPHHARTHDEGVRSKGHSASEQ
jgi:hypothetical protein